MSFIYKSWIHFGFTVFVSKVCNVPYICQFTSSMKSGQLISPNLGLLYVINSNPVKSKIHSMSTSCGTCTKEIWAALVYDELPQLEDILCVWYTIMIAIYSRASIGVTVKHSSLFCLKYYYLVGNLTQKKIWIYHVSCSLYNSDI